MDSLRPTDGPGASGEGCEPRGEPETALLFPHFEAPSEEQRDLFTNWTPPEGPLVALKQGERDLLRRMQLLCLRANLPYCWAGQKYWAVKLEVQRLALVKADQHALLARPSTISCAKSKVRATPFTSPRR